MTSPNLLSFHFNLSILSTQSTSLTMASIKQFVTSGSGLDSLNMAEAPMPSPGHGEVLVEVHSVSLNFRDTEGGMSLLLQGLC